MDVKKEVWEVTVVTSTVHIVEDGKVKEYKLKEEIPTGKYSAGDYIVIKV